MSHTDKDRPWDVRVREAGFIHHDHTGDACVVGPLNLRWGTGRHHWRRNCAKRVEVHWTCTKDDPYRPSGYYRYWSTGLHAPLCWSWACGCPIPEEWKREPHGCDHRVRTGCLGHVRIETDPTRPCVCDDFPEPVTCYYTSPPERHYDWFGGGGVPRDYVNAVWRGPERRRERDDLGAAARLYNAGGPDALDDLDFPNFQHRHSARWSWH